MEITLMIMLSAAPIGAFDVIYFHLWKFQLYQRPESVKEEITHLGRGFLVPLIAVILLLGLPQGLWFWLVLALFALDTLNTLLDVVFEPASRAPRIVPPLELAVHFIGISAMGAAIAAFVINGAHGRLNETALAPYTNTLLPEWFFKFALLGLVGAFALAIFEAGLFFRAIKRRAPALRRAQAS